MVGLVFLLSPFVISPLAAGQDPYAILGCERKASQADIKAAFRAKARRFHPDRNREPDAHRKWILISDAYELLSDAKKRDKYDKLGIIDETLQDFKKTNTKDKLQAILAQEAARRSTSTDYGEFDYRQRPEVVVSLDDTTFTDKTSDGRPWVVFVYREEYDFTTKRQVLEDLFDKTGFLFGIARMQFRSCPTSVAFLGVKSVPQIVVFDRSANRISHFTGEPTLRSLTKFAAQQFGADVTVVTSDEEIVVWRKANLDKLHVILFSNLKEPPSPFELVAAFLKQTADFAFASIGPKNIENYPRALGSLTIEELPTYIVYRMGTARDDTFGGPVTPLVAAMELDAGVLSSVIRRYSFPVFSEINGDNFDRLCPEYCVLFVTGVELAEDIKRGVNDMNIPTGLVNVTRETDFVGALGLEAGDFAVLRRKTKEIAIWKELTTWMTFRKMFERMNIGIEKFSKIQDIPKLTRPVNAAGSVRTIDWKEIRENVMFAVNDLINQVYGKIKTYPSHIVLIAIGVALIVLGEALAFCCGRLCACCCRRGTASKAHTE